jgi:hypothetical protein
VKNFILDHGVTLAVDKGESETIQDVSNDLLQFIVVCERKRSYREAKYGVDLEIKFVERFGNNFDLLQDGIPVRGRSIIREQIVRAVFRLRGGIQ